VNFLCKRKFNQRKPGVFPLRKSGCCQFKARFFFQKEKAGAQKETREGGILASGTFFLAPEALERYSN